MLKSILLWLSRSKSMKGFFSKNRIFRRISRRFVAGETVKDAIESAKDLNSVKLLVAFDHLGENVKGKRGCDNATRHYLSLLKEASRNELITSSISVKLSQIGLDIDYDYCLKNAEKIAKASDKYGIRMEIDMEDSSYTRNTLDIYTDLRKKYKSVGICVQAYLYRTQNDIEKLIKIGSIIRIVKGAYKEPSDVAIQKEKEVDENFMKILTRVLHPSVLKNNIILIGTHNEKILRHALKSAIIYRSERDRFEIEMLYGIRKDLQRRLADGGYDVRIYMPYGKDWYPYLMRRLAERPANLWFLLKNLF